jgi:hypothetical protein
MSSTKLVAARKICSRTSIAELSWIGNAINSLGWAAKSDAVARPRGLRHDQRHRRKLQV